MISNITAKINFTDKDKTIMSVNHNYYVRTAIATLADMFMTFLICICLVAIVTIVCVLLGVANEGDNERTSQLFFIGAITFDACVGIFYFIYIIAKIGRVSHMRKRVNHIENAIIKSATVEDKVADTPDEVSGD